MRSLTFTHGDAVEAFCDQADGFLAAARSCDDLRLLGESRCHAWSRLDVVVHVRMGLEEMSLATTSRSDAEPDRDAASYWASHPDDRDDDPVPHILWLRRTASAYSRPRAAVDHLRGVVSGAVGAVRSMPECVVEFQRHRMRSGDFLATWVVELAVHQLDLGLDDDPDGLPWVRRTLEAVAEDTLPRHLDDRTAVLAGLGRVPSAEPLPSGFPVSL